MNAETIEVDKYADYKLNEVTDDLDESSIEEIKREPPTKKPIEENNSSGLSGLADMAMNFDMSQVVNMIGPAASMFKAFTGRGKKPSQSTNTAPQVLPPQSAFITIQSLPRPFVPSQVSSISRSLHAYWDKQPISVNPKNQLAIIDKTLIMKESISLPDGFNFKILDLSYIDEIKKLLDNCYIEDNDNTVRLQYSKKYLYWYMKMVPPGLIIGLVYKDKLVGMIVSSFMQFLVMNTKMVMPFINFFCIHKKLRGLNLAPAMMDEIKKRLCSINKNYAFFVSPREYSTPFCSPNLFVIPLNTRRLREVGLLDETVVITKEDVTLFDKLELRLMKENDIISISKNLNIHLQKYAIKPLITNEFVRYFFLPRKEIVYSFVKRDSTNQEVTDFISVYQNYYYCIESKQKVSIAILSFYYYTTMTLTKLVSILIDKLKEMGIDQLNLYNIMENDTIKITMYNTSQIINYYMFNLEMFPCHPSNISILPI